MKRIGGKLTQKVETVKKEKFNDWVSSGNRLSYDDIRKLNPDYKDDYIHQI